MNIEQARAILAQAVKDKTYEDPIPQDDAKAISEAEGLVAMAQTAWDQYVRGPEVEALLRIANEDFSGSDAPPAEPTPESEPTPEPPAAEADPEPEPTPAQEPEPEADAPAEDPLAQIEPWEGYSDEKASDVISAIQAAQVDYSEDEMRDLLANIWAFENSHKSRSTIISELEKVAAKLNGEEAPAADPEPEPTPEPEPPPEPTPEPVPEPAADPEDPEPQEATSADPAEEQQADPAPDTTATEEPGQRPVGDASTEDRPSGDPAAGKDDTPPSDSDQAYSELISEVEAQVKRERQHTPEPPQEEIPDLPWDWTRLSDGDLQKFYGIYSALAYYKSYILARENRMAVHCKAAADELHRDLLIALDKYDASGKEKKVAVVEAEVEADKNVIMWRRRQRKHETFAAATKSELDSYNKLVESLSRLESMRHQEWERTGGKVGRGRSKPGS